MKADAKLLKAWRVEFGSMPVDAGDIVSAPRVRKAMADAIPWPADYLTARMIGRRIGPLMGDAVLKLPTPRKIAQKWSLK